MASASSNFNTAENPLSEGGVWDNGAGAWGTVQATGTVAQPTTANTDSLARRNSPTFGGNHYAEVKSASLNNGDHGPCVRIASATDGDCYYLARGSSAWVRIYRISDTGSLSFIQLGSDFAAAANNDILRLDINGSTLTYFKNGVSQGTRSDATLSGGQPGFAVYGASAVTDSQVDDWSADDGAAGGRTTKNTRAWPLGVDVGMAWRLPA